MSRNSAIAQLRAKADARPTLRFGLKSVEYRTVSCIIFYDDLQLLNAAN